MTNERVSGAATIYGAARDDRSPAGVVARLCHENTDTPVCLRGGSQSPRPQTISAGGGVAAIGIRNSPSIGARRGCLPDGMYSLLPVSKPTSSTLVRQHHGCPRGASQAMASGGRYISRSGHAPGRTQVSAGGGVPRTCTEGMALRDDPASGCRSLRHRLSWPVSARQQNNSSPPTRPAPSAGRGAPETSPYRVLGTMRCFFCRKYHEVNGDGVVEGMCDEERRAKELWRTN